MALKSTGQISLKDIWVERWVEDPLMPGDES